MPRRASRRRRASCSRCAACATSRSSPSSTRSTAKALDPLALLDEISSGLALDLDGGHLADRHGRRLPRHVSTCAASAMKLPAKAAHRRRYGARRAAQRSPRQRSAIRIVEERIAEPALESLALCIDEPAEVRSCRRSAKATRRRSMFGSALKEFLCRGIAGAACRDWAPGALARKARTRVVDAGREER